MAISQENEKLADLYLRSIDSSNLSLDEQAAWIELINSCKIATNGFSQQEKIQKMSENTLKMVGRMLYDRIQTVKVNEEFRNLNRDINLEVAKVKAELSERFDKIEKSNVSLEKKIVEKFSSVEEKMNSFSEVLGKLNERLDKNDKETYVLIGKDAAKEEKSQKKQGWLKTIFDGFDKLKWAIVTLGGIIVVATAFNSQVGSFIERVLGMIVH